MMQLKKILTIFILSALSMAVNAATVHVGFLEVSSTKNTMPGTDKKFVTLSRPSISQGRVVFSASNGFFHSAIYNNIYGYSQLVVDNQTRVPAGHDNFLHFIDKLDCVNIPKIWIPVFLKFHSDYYIQIGLTIL